MLYLMVYQMVLQVWNTVYESVFISLLTPKTHFPHLQLNPCFNPPVYLAAGVKKTKG